MHAWAIKKVYRTLQKERKSLEALEIKQTQKYILFFKQKTWHVSPKLLKILAWKVKKHSSSKLVPSVRLPSGDLSYNSKTINDTFVQYYKSLYSSSNPPSDLISSYLQKVIPSLSLKPELKDLLEEPFTIQETLAAIKRLKLHKSPGTDGLPANFYKTFASSLIAPLTELYNQVSDNKTMPPSWSESRIIVIHKQGKDPSQPSSYCPISLLNQDFKIMSSILVCRLKKFISHYISPDHGGFITQRNIVDNIKKTLYIIQHYQRTLSPLLLQAIDIEKAFDRLEHHYIHELFQHMGFGSRFISITGWQPYPHPSLVLHISVLHTG